MKKKILLTGAGGQLGRVLADALASSYEADQIVVSDIREFESPYTFTFLDVTNQEAIAETVRHHNIDQIYHLAAILSAKGEQHPLRTQQINLKGYLNVLEVSRQLGIARIFYPSSIAVFGKGANLSLASQFEPLLPTTVYGITKVDGELWSQYYFQRYGLDIRSLRFPGVIGYQTEPGGGTTDYAVHIFHSALAEEVFTCFLTDNSCLPMIYMEDAIRAIIELMEAPSDKLRIRHSYNLAGCSFTPSELYQEIKHYHPNFEIIYEPDFRQMIAASWPERIDDAYAQEDWGWSPTYDLSAITRDMLQQLSSAP